MSKEGQSRAGRRTQGRKNTGTSAHGWHELELASALEAIERAGLRRTQPRIAILKALIAEHGPFSVDELREFTLLDGIDRVTVYRVLTAFEELGLVRRCEFGDGTSRYEFAGGGHHHHHVICKKCRKTENVDECIPEAIIQRVRKLGYDDVSHTLEFFGVCKTCRAA
jgi:Fur family ferric uptake transcriptional regulator